MAMYEDLQTRGMTSEELPNAVLVSAREFIQAIRRFA